MALPTQVHSNGDLGGFHGPFKSSGGSFYAFAPNVDTLRALRATDPTDSWTAQDTAGEPTIFGTIVGAMYNCVQDGDVIHIVSTVPGVSPTVDYHQFNMATDNWDVADEEVEALGASPLHVWASIAVRSDGDIVVVYAGSTDQVMGGTKERVDLNIRTGGTWGGAVVLGDLTDTDVHYGNPNCVLAGDSDDIHIVYQFTSNTTDPPAAWTTSIFRTLDSGDSLSSETSDIVDTTIEYLGIQNGLSFDDGGTQVIRFVTGGFSSGFEQGEVFMAEESAGDAAWESPSHVNFADASHEVKISGEAAVCSIAGPDANGDLHVLWSNADDGNDIWYVTSDDTGDTWSAEAEEVNTVTCNRISANIYVRGIDTVLAFTYGQIGITTYNEKVIIEGVAGDPQPMIIRGTNVTHVRQWHPRGLRR